MKLYSLIYKKGYIGSESRRKDINLFSSKLLVNHFNPAIFIPSQTCELSPVFFGSVSVVFLHAWWSSSDTLTG